MLIVWIFFNCFLVILNCLVFFMQARGQTQWGPEGWSPEGWSPEGWSPEGWSPEGWSPEGWSPEGWGAQNFALFFPSPATKFFLFFPLYSLLVEFWWCLKRRRPSNVHVWSSRAVVCEPRRPGLVGPPGHTTTREPERAHLGVPAFKNTTKIQREDPQRGKKRTNFAAGEGKKRAKFWRSRGRAVQGKGGPNQTLKPRPHMKPHSDTVKQPRHTDNTQHNTNTTHNKSNSFWPKSVLANVGPYH